MIWDTWKKGFDAWESTTAGYVDKLLRNKAVLGPAGAVLSATMKSKAQADKAVAMWWGAMGLPTKRDQERGLHKLAELESKLLDLEDELARTRDGGSLD